MPILVVCPACGARLNAPDSAAGKHVRCPKAGCGTLVPVPTLLPAEEVVEAVPVAPPPRPARAAAGQDDDRPRRRPRDDDEDDDDYRPRRKLGRDRERSRGNPAVIAGIVLGALVVCAGLGYGVYALASKKSDAGPGLAGLGSGLELDARSRIPAGWKEYRYPRDKFRAYFPGDPIVQRQPGGTDVTIYLSAEKTDRGDGTGVYLMVVHFPADSPAAQREEWLRETPWLLGGNPDATTSAPRAVKWAGRDAREHTVTNAGQRRGSTGGAVVRIMLVGPTAYIAMIGTDNGRARPEDEAGFFDNFVLVN